MHIYNRPFLSMDEQLERMDSKNIKFIGYEDFVRECLESHSYYTIVNGYKDIFGTYFDEEKSLERFNYNVEFNQIYTLYTIDTNLNSILFKYILYVERSLKTKLSYVVAREFGVDMSAYLDKKNYKSNGNLDRLSEVQKIERQIQLSKNASVVHYRNSHNHIPPWIAVNALYFGTAINWYKILKSSQKNEVTKQFFDNSNLKILDDQKTLLPDILSLVQIYRNNMAHGNRTFETNVANELPKIELLKIIPKEILTEQDFLNGYGKKDILAVMFSIVIMINDKYILTNFILDLKTLFDPFTKENTILSHKGNIYQTLNLPENFINRLQLFVQKKFS